MCEPASMIATKKRIYWSEKTDSHHLIIKEFGIRETDVSGNINIVPVEIVPPNHDYTLPFNKWVFKVDYQGYNRDLPNWADLANLEEKTRLVLPDWAKANLVKKGKKDIFDYAIVCGQATVVLWDSSSAELRDSSSAVLYGLSSAVLHNSSSAELRGCKKYEIASSLGVIIDRRKQGKVTTIIGKKKE